MVNEDKAGTEARAMTFTGLLGLMMLYAVLRENGCMGIGSLAVVLAVVLQ